MCHTLSSPRVMGLSVLVFRRTPICLWIEATGLSFVYQRRGIVRAQFFVTTFLGIRAIKAAFDNGDRRQKEALTLGCIRGQVFWHVAVPNTGSASPLWLFAPLDFIALSPSIHSQPLASEVVDGLSQLAYNAGSERGHAKAALTNCRAKQY